MLTIGDCTPCLLLVAMLLAPRDVARRLKLSTSRIIQLDLEGRLPAFRDKSGRRFYDEDTVEEYARQREADQANAAVEAER